MCSYVALACFFDMLLQHTSSFMLLLLIFISIHFYLRLCFINKRLIIQTALHGGLEKYITRLKGKRF